MSTSLKFPRPKDPDDQDWYGIPFSVTLGSVDNVSCEESKPTLPGTGAFSTPGDSLVGRTPLVVANGVVGNDGKGGINNTAMMWVTNGIPGKSYALRAAVTDTNGNKLSRSAILSVTGL